MQDISKCFEKKKFALPVTGVEENSLLARGHFLLTGFVPFFEQKIQELFEDLQGHISHFLKDSI